MAKWLIHQDNGIIVNKCTIKNQELKYITPTHRDNNSIAIVQKKLQHSPLSNEDRYQTEKSAKQAQAC